MSSIIYIITFPIRLTFRIIRFVLKTTLLLIACLFIFFLLVLFFT